MAAPAVRMASFLQGFSALCDAQATGHEVAEAQQALWDEQDDDDDMDDHRIYVERTVLNVNALLLAIERQDRHRSRYAVRRVAVTGLAASGWAHLRDSRDEDTYLAIMGLTPALFDELLDKAR